jgi:hypothetical protein
MECVIRFTLFSFLKLIFLMLLVHIVFICYMTFVLFHLIKTVTFLVFCSSTSIFTLMFNLLELFDLINSVHFTWNIWWILNWCVWKRTLKFREGWGFLMHWACIVLGTIAERRWWFFKALKLMIIFLLFGLKIYLLFS